MIGREYFGISAVEVVFLGPWTFPFFYCGVTVEGTVEICEVSLAVYLVELIEIFIVIFSSFYDEDV